MKKIGCSMFKTSILFGTGPYVFMVMILCYIPTISHAQVKSSIDTTAIKIGQQITYNVQVETDTTTAVLFPEGQTFQPLEVIESYPTDTIKNKAKYNLIKKYGLTQFDSGTYTIPQQKIVIGNTVFYTDSLKVEVNTIEIDTTKQGLYDIKPLLEVKKTGGNWWKYVLVSLLIIGMVAALLWWFIWRQKPLSQEEQIALLPPYDRAKLALKKLDESDYLKHQELKEYYSELTLIIRKYLDEKVYDHALESTTDELITRLRLLKDGNQIDLSQETIKNLESILRRADLVKFAKSAPDVALAQLDRNTIDAEIDHVKEVLPEPTEDEKLLDEQYREEQERKKKRKKIWITVAIGIGLLLATVTGFSIKYGFNYVKDTVIGHDSKTLLEGEWVTSDYGVPPITISTPKVLKRISLPLAPETQANVQTTTFMYGTLLDAFSVVVNTTKYQGGSDENTMDLEAVAEASIKQMEAKGAKNITVLKNEFETPNGAKGIKTEGSFSIENPLLKETMYAKYVLLQFNAKNVFQQIMVTYPNNDTYADVIAERIINSVELQKEVQN